jgi:hypothetical protein
MTPVLLLNPPWPASILRDYWCSSVAKAGYLWQPIDLLAQTGWLDHHGIGFQVIDAIAERLSVEECLRRVSECDPALVYLLTSPLSAPEDDAFMAALGTRRLIVSGEAACADPAAYLAGHPGVEGVLKDFVGDALARHVLGERGALPGLFLRGDAAAPGASMPRRQASFRMPVPRHLAFPGDAYRMPLLGGVRFATVMTDFGCPYRCRFCNSGASGHRLRDIANVVQELEAMQRWGFRHVFVKDMSFGAVRGHSLAVCAALQRSGLTWHAYARADCLDPPLVRAMAGAGCRLVQIGLESGDRDLRRTYGKNLDDAVLESAVRTCKAAGLKVGGHFVLGLPGETPTTLLRTYRLAARLRPDYVSFNVATVRQGSDFDGARSPGFGPDPERWTLAARNLMYLAYYSDVRWLWQVLRGADGKDLRDLAVSGTGLWRSLVNGRAERGWLRRLRAPAAGPGAPRKS